MVWEFFKDGSPPRWHIHPIKKIKGKRPRPPGALTRLVTKAEWKAKPILQRYPLEITALVPPLHTVRYTYTDSWECENPDECKHLLRMLQENHIYKFSFDIKWNFLIAPDGSVYEGRGWTVDPLRPEKFDYLKGRSIDIAYIGNYIAKPVHKPMLEAAEDLVDWGVHNGYINCCHDTISHKVPQVDDDYECEEVP